MVNAASVENKLKPSQNKTFQIFDGMLAEY